ncbi:Bug family tripartite tricarboxylate transporter substrate binding protein [Paracidovorax cattleyae]|uniref:Tripartite-type tricarboxylate transporter, receptor component TctC n=1 Tax=Paracidovorax cattleyae TaxID=80868 RepID=A0A1H0WA96_9BURK|nr:tripartite tricarboxylate transporter substrate binding protein [Paracidovorax cattleyae]SDP87632.1 Tripartite-type tricarboxylate transporter, receptor component TctC [Paracidovorax cattleyae]
MKSLLKLTVSTLVLAAAAGTAFAQGHGSYPDRPIRLVVPYPPGGGNDTVSRAVGQKISEALGQPVIVDNKAGANGLIAGEYVAKAGPDGYTLMMANVGSHGINSSLYKKMPYDAVNDFVPVSLVGTSPNVLVVHPSLKVKSVKELVAYAKAHPGKVTYGSNGAGSSQQLAGAMFANAFGLDMVHVPYRGTGPMMTDLLGGQTSMSFGNIIAVAPYIKSGQLVPLAVSTPKRSVLLPELPTIAESSPGFDATVWWGIVASKGTPAPVADLLSRTIRKALESPEIRAQLASAGAEPRGSTPTEFKGFIQSELKKWGQVVKDTGATAD